MRPRRHTADDRRRRLAMIVRRCRTLTAVLVIEHLARLEGKYDRITPSREGIAKAIGRSERSVSRAVGELEAAGAVAVWRDRPHGRKDGTWCRKRTNMYRITWPPANRETPGRPEGTRVSRLSDSQAIDPNGGARTSAPTPLDPVALTLFEPEPLELEPDPPAPVPPPWVTEGLTMKEWVRRCQTASI
jgi:hypothetical protein